MHDVLFPYVLEHLESYLTSTYDTPQTRDDIRALIFLSQSDHSADPSLPVIPSSPIHPTDPSLDPPVPSAHPSYPAQLSSVLFNVRRQMSTDRKSTPLKALQGHMWSQAFHSRAVTAPLYADVHEALPRWWGKGLRVGVYSSGSVEAQRLLFGFTDRGDVSRYMGAGWWDTRVGAKQESASYARIVGELGVEAHRMLFLTDVEGEARACREAGAQAMIVVRPGNKPVDPTCGIPIIHSFDEVNVDA